MFTTRQVLKKYIFKKHDFEKKFQKHGFEEKKYFLQARFWKNNYFVKSWFSKIFCTQKNHVWFNLPRKMRKFCVLLVILKSTILKNFFFSKITILIEKLFVKSMILDDDFFVLSDCEQELFRHVRFWIKIFLACLILNQIFFVLLDLN